MTTSSDRERVLFDTNIWVNAMNRDAEHHEACHGLRARALAGTLDVVVTAQVLFEYFAVVTNPSQLVSPLSSTEGLADIEKLATLFPLIVPPEDLHERVVDLMRRLDFSGRHVFDVQLAATMLANDVTTIYTYDPRFQKIPGLDALIP